MLAARYFISIPGGNIERPHLLHGECSVIPHCMQVAQVLLGDFACQILATESCNISITDRARTDRVLSFSQENDPPANVEDASPVR